MAKFRKTHFGECMRGHDGMYAGCSGAAKPAEWVYAESRGARLKQGGKRGHWAGRTGQA